MPPLTISISVSVFVAGLLPWMLGLTSVQDPEVAAIFRSVCHQMPERTLAILGTPLLVCSRCAGLYAGVALGVLRPLPTGWLPHARRLLGVAVALMVADVVTQDLGLHPICHATRLGTGLAVGWVASAWMFCQLGPRS